MQKVTHFQLDVTADLLKWRTFLVIAELGSLTRAALYLDSTQSQLSRHLNALERECNARLFVRTGRGVALSDFGQRVLPHVKALLGEAEQLEAEIHGQAKEPAGRVVLGSLPSITHPIIVKLFQRLQSSYPAISLKILEGSSGQVEEWLADGRIDLAILYRYNKRDSSRRQHLAVVDSFLIGAAGDKRTANETIDFAALDGLPFILPGIPNGLRSTLDALARQHQILLAPALEADSLPLMRSVVAQAGLYTVLPLHAVWSEVREGRLQASRIVSPPIVRHVSMEFAQSKGPSRAVSAVARGIMQIMDEGTQTGLWNTRPQQRE